jgi:flagellar basal body-associated protein FliL
MSGYYWIAVIVFVVVALGAGLTQILFFHGDKKNTESVTRERERLHTHPRDPENPSSPGDDQRS